MWIKCLKGHLTAPKNEPISVCDYYENRGDGDCVFSKRDEVKSTVQCTKNWKGFPEMRFKGDTEILEDGKRVMLWKTVTDSSESIKEEQNRTVKIVKPNWSILQIGDVDDMYAQIERCARTCYLSESKSKSSTDTAKFVKMLVDSGHHSQLEHVSITVRFVTDREIANEIVSHRMASYSQESTRFVTYTDEDGSEKEVGFVKPSQIKEDSRAEELWYRGVQSAEAFYLALIGEGVSAQNARSVLPLCTATTLVVTANLREWRHIFKLRCDKPAHPDMRNLMCPLALYLSHLMPEVFCDIPINPVENDKFETEKKVAEAPLTEVGDKSYRDSNPATSRYIGHLK
jgi:thymidylate synthase (FAD)